LQTIGRLAHRGKVRLCPSFRRARRRPFRARLWIAAGDDMEPTFGTSSISGSRRTRKRTCATTESPAGSASGNDTPAAFFNDRNEQASAGAESDFARIDSSDERPRP
jgi:hypothetical protein